MYIETNGIAECNGLSMERSEGCRRESLSKLDAALLSSRVYSINS
jgi:hypothetical protein